MITPLNKFRIYDSSLWIDCAPNGHKPRVIYHRLCNLLQSRGWALGIDTFNGRKKNPSRWGWQTCIGQKGDLHCYAEFHEHHNSTGGNIKFDFWQNLVLEEGRTCGRWSFNKRDRMPFLIRLQWQATVNAMQAFLGELGFTFELCDWQHQQQKGMAFILQQMATSCHTPKDYDPLTHTSKYSYNILNANKEPILPGHRYMAYIDKRLVVGTAYYNLNNMWWLLSNDQTRPLNVSSYQLFPAAAGHPRRQSQSREKALEVIQSHYRMAQKRKNWKRCQQFAEYLAKVA